MNNRFKQGPFQIVSTRITGAGQTVNLPDVPQLRNDSNQRITIKMIEVITVNILGFDPNNTATVNAPTAELLKATLVLYDNGWNKVYQFPVLMLNHMASDPAAFIPYDWNRREFNDLNRVDWNKSQFVFVAAPTPTYSILLGVSYKREELNPQDGSIVKIDE